MLNPEIVQIAVIFLAALSAGGVIYVIVMPFLTDERKSGKRVNAVSSRQKSVNSRVAAVSVQKKRRAVQDTLDELEAKAKERKNVTLRTRLVRAGIDAPNRSFYITSAILGIGTGVLAFLVYPNPIVVVLAVFAAGLGLPRWFLNHLAKKRQKSFTAEFANAVDIIVRGVKTGLPLNDCLQIISQEASDPVKSEFVDLVEQQRVGIPMAKALERMYERMPLQEVNFFGIVIAIQQQAGGNLAEALGNLSNVLRARKKLRGKVLAFSQEAKSSAAIIAALPLVVMGTVYITRPDYIALLWTHETGKIMLAVSAFWMTCGVLVMRKMINFDY